MVLAVVGWLTLAAAAPSADTVLMLGSRAVDLTGDGRPEEVQIVASGPSLDRLSVTLTVLSGFELLYAAELPADLGAYRGTDFLERRIVAPEAFVAERRPRDVPLAIARDRGEPLDLVTAQSIWDEIQRGALPVLVLPSGDRDAIAVAWSEPDHRFVLLDAPAP